MEYSKELYFFALAVFVLYTSFIMIKYGVQKSISDSYYRLSSKYKFLFTLFCWGFAIPAMILGNNLLMVLAGSFICFVGAASMFKKNKSTKLVHMIGAYGGVLLSQVSICVYYKMWYVAVIFFTLSGILFIFKTKNKIWWAEILAFLSIFYVIYLTL